MKLRNLLSPLAMLFSLLIASRLEAQVIFNNTIGSETSKVVPIDSIKEMIEGGAIRGENLFHSFLEFNILEGKGIYFSNPEGVINILSRVTGGNPSQILGTLGVMGEANLYLLNPAGIIFGENSSLDIQGNFTATTATQINLGKEGYFSATNPGGSSLLSVSPSALFFNQVAAQGEAENPPQPPFERGGYIVTEGNLTVNPGQTLALIGGNVNISGGNLTAPSGRIELGAVGEGEVGLGNWIFPENPVRKIIVVNGSLIDITGDAPGKIGVNAATLQLENGAEMLGGGGEITVNAGEVNLSEGTAINNTVTGVGNAGNIEVATENLSLSEGGRIESITQGEGAGGEIRINATESIKITGFTADGLLSGILTYAEEAKSGAGGNIIINSPEVNLASRGFIASVTNSNSSGGNVKVNVNNLTLESGGQIITWTTVGGGSAGNITINAADTVTIAGRSRDFVPSPFEGIITFNLDELEFSTEANPDVEESGAGGIPYVSVERTPEEIVSGNTVLGAAEDGVFDYYTFTITKGESRGIFDIDYGVSGEGLPEDIDTEIFLFDYATGELLEGNDDSDISDGAGGSILAYDSYIATKLNQPGKYVIVVGEWDSQSSTFNPIEGNKIDAGDTYTLQVSLENQGTQGIYNPTDNINPDNFNPNQGGNSGLFSVSSSGNGGKVNINAERLVMENGGEVSTTSLAEGRGGDINISAKVINLSDALVSTITRGSGNSGNIIVETESLSGENGSELNASGLSS